MIDVEPDKGTEMHFHDGSGASYLIKNNMNTNLENYPRTDVLFTSDTQTYSSNQIESYFVFTTEDQRKTYFAIDGRVLGIKDRFDNEIRFEYVNRFIDGVEYPFLHQITDSIGRIIQFAYENTINDNPFSQDNITVTVTHPSEPGKQIQVKYTKKRDSVDGRYEPYLYSVTLAPNTTDQFVTYYEYDRREQRFNYRSGNLDGQNGTVQTQLLKSIVYPHSVTYYEYGTTKRRLSGGAMDAFRVKDRYDLPRVGSILPSISKQNI